MSQSFAGVRPIGFQSVVGLSLLYILVLGPVQFFFIRGWLKKSWVAWISLSLVSLLFGTGAIVIANVRAILVRNPGLTRPRSSMSTWRAGVLGVPIGQPSIALPRGALTSPFRPDIPTVWALCRIPSCHGTVSLALALGGMGSAGTEFGPIGIGYQIPRSNASLRCRYSPPAPNPFRPAGPRLLADRSMHH